MHRLALPALAVETRREPGALVRLQPQRVSRPVGQIEIGDKAEQHGRRRLDDEQPLPALQSADAVHAEDDAGNRRADHRGQRNRRHERADDAATIDRGEPQRQIEDDAGKEAGLGEAEQRAHGVERDLVAEPGGGGNVGDERHQAGENPPAHHDARDPLLRAEPVEEQVRRQLENKIAEKEDAGAETEHGRGQAERLVHGQRGKADIHPVEIGDEIADDQIGNEPRRDLFDRSGFHVRHSVLHSVLPVRPAFF